MCLQEKLEDSKEEWRDIPGYEGLYCISSHGRITAYDRAGEHQARWGIAKMKFPGGPRVLSTTTKGYKYIALKKPGQKGIKFLFHRLVMLTFVGSPEKGMQVNHKDGDKENNHLSNLEYCTSLQNLRHCIDVLGKKRGEGGSSKLTELQVRSIRKDERVLRVIAADYGVTLQAIWMVKKRKNWAHLQD